MQRRDIGNELIVAIIAVGVLAFALTFGVIISLSNSAATSTPAAIGDIADAPTAETATLEGTPALAEAVVESSPTGSANASIEPSPTAAETTVVATQTEIAASPTPIPPTEAVNAAATITVPAINTATEVPPSETPTRASTLVTVTPTDVAPTAEETEGVSSAQVAVNPTATFTATNTPVPPTETLTATNTRIPPTATNTPVPLTATFTATNTPVPPTETLTATNTRIPPTATNTPVPPTATFTATNTPIPPTETLTATNTRIPPTATNTLVPPTATFTATNTPIPPTASFTPTNTATNTRVPPSATPTSTNTSAPPTFTVSPANSPTPVFTPTETFVLPTAIVLSSETELPPFNQLLTPAATILGCGLPPGWTTYTVQRGDNLFVIARSVGSSVEQLTEVNCLQNAANLQVGDVLFVPRVVLTPIPTTAPVLPTPAAPPQAAGCTNPGALLVAPTVGQRITDAFVVLGTASVPNFRSFRIEIRPEGVEEYTVYREAFAPVSNGLLAFVNVDLLDEGLHWIRLVVEDTFGSTIEPCAIPVIIQ